MFLIRTTSAFSNEEHFPNCRKTELWLLYREIAAAAKSEFSVGYEKDQKTYGPLQYQIDVFEYLVCVYVIGLITVGVPSIVWPVSGCAGLNKRFVALTKSVIRSHPVSDCDALHVSSSYGSWEDLAFSPSHPHTRFIYS